ncbi:MAG: hypothetical protein AMXMBFR13_22500 [Phycisphaerae bacterium]
MDITDVPERYHKLYQRAMSGRSQKAAIRAHCLMCCGWSRREVEACTAPGCPLYALRCPSARKPARTPQKTGT